MRLQKWPKNSLHDLAIAMLPNTRQRKHKATARTAGVEELEEDQLEMKLVRVSNPGLLTTKVGSIESNIFAYLFTSFPRPQCRSKQQSRKASGT